MSNTPDLIFEDTPDYFAKKEEKSGWQISAERSRFGAYQNRMEHTIKNLDNVVENTTNAESRIRDADMAKESVSNTKSDILMQTIQAMLTQANHNPENVLSMLLD